MAFLSRSIKERGLRDNTGVSFVLWCFGLSDKHASMEEDRYMDTFFFTLFHCFTGDNISENKIVLIFFFFGGGEFNCKLTVFIPKYKASTKLSFAIVTFLATTRPYPMCILMHC